MTYENNTKTAWQLVKEGEFQLAYEMLTEKIAQQPNNAPFFANRGTCLLAMHRLQEALHDFQKEYELLAHTDAGAISTALTLIKRQ
jgi:predicted Zn-dependent protease